MRRCFAEMLLAVRKSQQSRWLQQGSKNGRKLLKLEIKEAERVQKFIEHKIDTKLAQRLFSAPTLCDCQKWQVKSQISSTKPRIEKWLGNRRPSQTRLCTRSGPNMLVLILAGVGRMAAHPSKATVKWKLKYSGDSWKHSNRQDTSLSTPSIVGIPFTNHLV
jgi:hypothetical protein